jgi:hypothetical protein
MEAQHGFKLEKNLLKKEGGEYLYFKTLKNKDPEAGKVLTNELLEQFEYLSVTPEDEISGFKNGTSTKVTKIKGAYQIAMEQFGGQG